MDIVLAISRSIQDSRLRQMPMENSCLGGMRCGIVRVGTTQSEGD
jgi:hypothetical protein